jgi:hypothetical protein
MPLKRLRVPLSATVLALGAAGCGTATTSTSAFKGEQHEVAQAVANLQSDLTSSEQKKLCANDFAASVVAGLRSAAGSATGANAGCEAALKKQLTEIDNLELAVDSVTVTSTGAKPTARAVVRSIYEGKTRESTLELVKEGGKWKLSRAELLPVKATTSSSSSTSTGTTRSSTSTGTTRSSTSTGTTSG